MKLRTYRRLRRDLKAERDSLADANDRLQQTVRQQGATIRDLQVSLRIERERTANLGHEVDRLRQALSAAKGKKNIHISFACPACGYSTGRFLFEPTDETPPDGVEPVCEIVARGVTQ